jgi:hypothetical protein
VNPGSSKITHEPASSSVRERLTLFDPFSTVVYGVFAGEGGDPPRGRVALRAFVAHEHGRPVLLSLLTGPNPGARAYAAEGLLRLAKKGVAFDDDTKRAIAWVREKDVPVEVALGCTFLEERAGKHMKDFLEDDR